ncbi:hypothetical protein [Woeseia oceani]|uniref:hypothetical protein n=1 Tax=Woeseia oceani TaxID=1548547 RepID=UPI0012E99DDB|nr:hypothetical protein [Woeseia oceani]
MAERRRSIATALCCGLLVAVPVLATDELPEAELLEYLGSWAETEADWVLLQSGDRAPAEAENADSDPESKDDESQESEHER